MREYGGGGFEREEYEDETAKEGYYFLDPFLSHRPYANG